MLVFIAGLEVCYLIFQDIASFSSPTSILIWTSKGIYRGKPRLPPNSMLLSIDGVRTSLFLFSYESWRGVHTIEKTRYLILNRNSYLAEVLILFRSPYKFGTPHISFVCIIHILLGNDYWEMKTQTATGKQNCLQTTTQSNTFLTLVHLLA